MLGEREREEGGGGGHCHLSSKKSPMMYQSVFPYFPPCIHTRELLHPCSQRHLLNQTVYRGDKVQNDSRKLRFIENISLKCYTFLLLQYKKGSHYIAYNVAPTNIISISCGRERGKVLKHIFLKQSKKFIIFGKPFIHILSY